MGVDKLSHINQRHVPALNTASRHSNDFWDACWIPRLLAGQAVDGAASLLRPKNPQKYDLNMSHFSRNHEYPRPNLVRDSYFDLNGIWEFAPCEGETFPKSYSDTIEVPYPPQAYVRGRKPINPGKMFWYRKKVSLPGNFQKDRLLLHFGAVDQIARVYINGQKVGEHKGGYLPFTFDITDYVDDSAFTIEVFVEDTLNPVYPYGKQSDQPKGMWYTQVSGIWKSVWLEAVSENALSSIEIHSHLQWAQIELEGKSDSYLVKVYAPRIADNMTKPLIDEGENPVLELKNCQGKMNIYPPVVKNWTPEHPYLYPIVIESDYDRVTSYFALRTISIRQIGRIKRICLNEKPYFFHGILDQGYYSEGLYTPVSDRYYEYDIRNMKRLGFNTLRKHLKIEADYYYYACDRIGMLVFQDMVNNGTYRYLHDTIQPTLFDQWKDDKKLNTNMDCRNFFLTHSIETIEHLKNFPSIVLYTVFNEGWGQFDSLNVTRILKEIDNSRLYDGASGWFKQFDGDVDSDHVYFHKIRPNSWSKPVLITECGGYSAMAKSHTYCPDRSYGYGSCKNRAELADRIENLYLHEVIPNIRMGICGCIYTQLSDVEEELNGLYTYDRAVLKVSAKRMKRIAGKLRKTFERENGR